MKNRTGFFASILFSMLFNGSVWSQQSVFGPLYPLNPTSTDTLKVIGDFTCGGAVPFDANSNSYRVSMSQNNITLILGRQSGGIVPTCATGSSQEFELGRFPAGNYTLTVESNQGGNSATVILFPNFSFTVTDARATKATPYVRLDYSGSWWDPADSGWGLFIWQDAKSPTDNLLVAWFTYTPDGKPMWYVTQPGWTSATATATAQLLQVSRLPGLTSPPPTAGSSVSVGTASLDFTNTGTADVGKITYTFTGGVTLTRNIQRFKP